MAPRLVILGWDSATFDVTDRLVAEGRLPVLSSLQQAGFRAPLRSTWPPMTDCAWTSAFTGLNPAGHGIFGSWYRAPGAYAPRYFSSRDRRAPALWELAQGIRFLVWNVPMAFPPEDIDGVMVSGYGAPPGADFCTPRGFQARMAGSFPIDDLVDRAPHSSLARFLDDLLRGLEVQARALRWAAEDSAADCVVAVWPHVDRAQHFFWRFRDSAHGLSDGVDRVYEAMDRTTGVLMDVWPEADVMVVSDHGAGPLWGDVNLGAWLHGRGLARYRTSRRSPLLRVAWTMPPWVRRLGRRAAPGLARLALGATLTGQLGPFEWTRTDAFCGLHGDLWLNLRGREPRGTLGPEAAERLRAELAEALLELRDPSSGDRLFAAAFRREALYRGPAEHLAPDLMVDSWSQGYRVSPNRGPSQLVTAPSALAGVREAWSADHRPLGIFVASGPRIAPGTAAELSLYDVCPTALALLERPIPPRLDGRVADAALDRSWLQSHPVATGEHIAGRVRDRAYSDDEAEAVAAHLKDLGYIE